MIKEPIYKANLSLNYNEAWNKALKFSKDYGLKKINKDSGIIFIDATYIYRLLSYHTWIEGIVIKIKSIGEKRSVIEVYGRPLISPHHILRTLVLSKKKIDKNNFIDNVHALFRKYEVFEYEIEKDSSSKNSLLFWTFEILSIFTFINIILQILILNNFDKPFLILISFIFFAFFQGILIIWLTRDCINRKTFTNKVRTRWMSYIALTAFVGCFFYYIFVMNPKNRRS